MNVICRTAFAVGTVVVIPATLKAADTTWTNASGDRQWSNPSNWSAGVPTATDVATLQANGTIALPVGTAALAGSVVQGFAFPPGSIELTGGRLVTNSVRGL